MLEAPAALISYLTQPNPSVVVADLLSIVIPGGSVLRYTNGLSPLTLAASEFAANSPLNGTGGPFTFAVGPRFDRVKLPPRKIGLDAQQTEVKLYPAQTDLIGDFTWQAFAYNEEFDSAEIEVDRFHWSADGSMTPLGSFITIYGRVADVEIGRTSLTFTAKTLPYLLDTPMPRRMYQAACNHVFGDPMCGYNRTAGENALGTSTGLGEVTITARAWSNAGEIVNAFSPSPATSYNLGTITCTAGANAGLSRMIQEVTPGVAVYPSRAFPVAPAVGDTFTLQPGCDHTVATCNSTFQNLLRFGGTPYVPPPELAV